jgi:hypothetical protein
MTSNHAIPQKRATVHAHKSSVSPIRVPFSSHSKAVYSINTPSGISEDYYGHFRSLSFIINMLHIVTFLGRLSPVYHVSCNFVYFSRKMLISVPGEEKYQHLSRFSSLNTRKPEKIDCLSYQILNN